MGCCSKEPFSNPLLSARIKLGLLYFPRPSILIQDCLLTNFILLLLPTECFLDMNSEIFAVEGILFTM